ncbi:MAG: RNA 2',3'-cyclic phosphodiesterase [Micrococcales bacterium]|nr:RNA 2',3'-cyclic phosphodiesterase [Micrococcales bacterium]
MTDRLFVAAFPPDAIVDDLEALISPRRGLTYPWRWSPPQNWHLTLAFLGDTPEDRQPRLLDALADVAATATPFTLELAGGHAIPSPNNARVLTLTATQGSAQATHLAARLRSACSQAGVPPDGKRFFAHLTLARSRNPASAHQLLPFLDTIPPLTWDVRDITLVASTLTRGASTYQDVRTFPLTG